MLKFLSKILWPSNSKKREVGYFRTDIRGYALGWSNYWLSLWLLPFCSWQQKKYVITGRLGNQTAYVEMQKKMVRPKITCVTGQASVACLENGGQQYYLEDVLRGLNKIRHVIYCTWYIITAQWMLSNTITCKKDLSVFEHILSIKKLNSYLWT